MSACGTCTLEDRLAYDPLTGMFRWKNPTARQAKGWFRGNRSVRDYRRLYIDGKHVLAHVVAWRLMTGEWPKRKIDHRDRDGGNNVWANLRQATQSQNGKNRSIASNNSTGVTGVTALGTRFRASIRVDGSAKHLGMFPTLASAAKARRNAETKYFGEFAGE